MEPLSPLDCKEVVSNFEQALEIFEKGAADVEVVQNWVENLLLNQIEGLQALLR